jgi:FMNH2-dependent dimethyl sulfone monooxygenase
LNLFSSVHITYKFHPLHIAKIGACIDHISNGRWALNIVTGVNQFEHAAFGNPAGIGHDLSYEMADEFTTLMKYLWSEEQPIDFEGRFYQAYGAVINPKPTRKPRPILMNAGNSDVGLDFACRQCDMVFITARTLDGYRARIEEVHRRAASYGRHIRTATMVYVILDATDRLAQQTADWVAEEIDRDVIRGRLEYQKNASYGKEFGFSRGNADSDDPWLGLDRESYTRFGLGIGAWPIFASYETAAETLRQLHDIGVESVLMGFFDPLRGLHQMENDVIPILRKMGLRR